MNNFQEKVSFIWSVADLLRGDYKQSENGRVILLLTVKGYEIPFTRHFYHYAPLRPLSGIESEIKELEHEIQGMFKEVLS